MHTYPVDIEPDDNGTFLVTFPDLPEAVTFGEDEDEALVRAGDALETAIIGLMAARREVPLPSKPRNGQRSVTLPALAAAKIGLYRAMQAAGLRKTDLARRLNVHLPQVDRFLDLRHASRLDQIESALGAVGKKLVVSVEDAA